VNKCGYSSRIFRIYKPPIAAPQSGNSYGKEATERPENEK